jgi:hypothetical protein
MKTNRKELGMDYKELGKKIDTAHKENREDHQKFYEALEGMGNRMVEAEKELIKRPTFSQTKDIAKEAAGFKHWIASAIGGVIGAASTVVAVLFGWNK